MFVQPLAYISPYEDPVIHLALESYFLDHCDQPVILVYRNRPSVIIGKNQNPLYEANLAYLKREGISWHRRMSGGGTVYHDLGNFNYSFIGPRPVLSENLYATYTEPLVSWLKSLGLNAGLDGRNGVVVDGLKVSGTAQCLRRDRFLHHGTCLVKSDLERLERALDTRMSPVVDSRSIASVRSEVTCLSEQVNGDWSMEQWQASLLGYVEKRFGVSFTGEFPEEAVAHAEAEAQVLHASEAWRLGRTPKYQVCHSMELGEEQGRLLLDIKQGKIEGVRCDGLNLPEGVEALFAGAGYGRQRLMELGQAAMVLCGKSWHWQDELESLDGLQ